MRYHYESHLGDGTIEAPADRDAVSNLLEKFGKNLMCISAEINENQFRTVWLDGEFWDKQKSKS